MKRGLIGAPPDWRTPRGSLGAGLAVPEGPPPDESPVPDAFRCGNEFADFWNNLQTGAGFCFGLLRFFGIVGVRLIEVMCDLMVIAGG